MTTRPEPTLAVHVAAAGGDVAELERLIGLDAAAVLEREATTNASALHYAAQHDQLEAVEALLRHRLPWNEVTFAHETAAEWAAAAGHRRIWDRLLAEGMRAEMLLALLAGDDDDDGDGDDDDDTSGGAANAAARFLQSRLTYVDGSGSGSGGGDGDGASVLVDADRNAVMMGWEAPLMQRHAAALHVAGRRVLNVGFGLGLVDGFLQAQQPAEHTIIEAHPDVLARMRADGWLSRPNVRVLAGRWQDVVAQLGTYDAIFFDTFSEDYAALKRFHALLPAILDKDHGIYSYFNGLAGTNLFFHHVSSNICQADLLDLGIETTMEEINVEDLGDDVWRGIARKYWSLPVYYLPTCRFVRDSDSNR
ncbi:hypothetical protein HK100_002198 [Physocladia obscura]|uniref:RMT2 domain-containing protein n=1 Tax=Physocladia obscura TaxID=109957 RepID=A0AAD5XG81_9FUNG|nr:hypothetical protein HK100_002198 [Physocladia obscura]